MNRGRTTDRIKLKAVVQTNYPEQKINALEMIRIIFRLPLVLVAGAVAAVNMRCAMTPADQCVIDSGMYSIASAGQAEEAQLTKGCYIRHRRARQCASLNNRAHLLVTWYEGFVFTGSVYLL